MRGIDRTFSVLLVMAFIASILASSGCIADVQAAEPLIKHAPIRVNSDAELAQLAEKEGWEGDGGAYVIENLEIDAAGAGAAIYLGNITSHVWIHDCLLYGAESFGQPYQGGAGLLLYRAGNVTVDDNECRYSVLGIALYLSDGAVLNENDCHDNTHSGIALTNSSGDEVTYNRCYDNALYGIYAVGSCNNTIGRNDDHDNSGIGIGLAASSDNNTVVNNHLSENDGYGIALTSSKNNSVRGNVLNDNNYASYRYSSSHAQAYDDGANHWNTSSLGNYWRDWTSPDADGNGIVDSPYVISGGSDRDDYPMSAPPLNVEILFPENNATYYAPVMMVTGHATPGYQVDVNGLTVDVMDFWDVETDGVFVLIIPLTVGNNTIEAKITTSFGEVSSSVNVTYVNPYAEGSDQDLGGTANDLLLIGLSVLSFIVGIVVSALFFLYVRKPKAP